MKQISKCKNFNGYLFESGTSTVKKESIDRIPFVDLLQF